MCCCLLETCFSILPVRWIQKVFSPLVAAITVILIGIALCGTGMRYWGGGVVCADMIWKQHCKYPLLNSTIVMCLLLKFANMIFHFSLLLSYFCPPGLAKLIIVSHYDTQRNLTTWRMCRPFQVPFARTAMSSLGMVLPLLLVWDSPSW